MVPDDHDRRARTTPMNLKLLCGMPLQIEMTRPYQAVWYGLAAVATVAAAMALEISRKSR
jgi:hypothetical protein